MVVWPYKVGAQVTSPTPSLKSAVRRLHLCTMHQEEQVFCSANNSGEDVTSTPVSSEVDERQSIGRMASPLPWQKREAVAIFARIYHSTRETSMSQSSHTPRTVQLVASHSHKRKSSRDIRSVQDKHLENERVRAEHQEVQEAELKKRSKGKMKPYRGSRKRNFTRKYFLKNRGLRYSQRQNLSYYCRSQGRIRQHRPYRI